MDRVDGKRKAKAISIPELDLVNQRYQDGTILFEEALALVSDIRKNVISRLRDSKHKPITNSENLRLLKRYWDEVYTLRHITDPRSMWNSLNWALRQIGSTPLLTIDHKDLHKKISSLNLSPNRHRRLISRLNQLLRFAGRPYILSLPQQEFLEIRYLNQFEVKELADSVNNEFDRHAILLAFATGCRVGEMFGISKESVRAPRQIHVGHQITKQLKKSLPKNRKVRRIRMLEIGQQSLAYWIRLQSDEKYIHRNRRLSDIVKFASTQLWPNKPQKHIRFHDLRHSYAIEMLRQGASISQVAQLLGDSVQVCQTYYAGFSMADESLDALDARLNSQFKTSIK